MLFITVLSGVQPYSETVSRKAEGTLSLQISSGVGNSGTVAPIQSVTPSSTGATGTQAPPQYQLDFTGLSRSAALGLSNPTSLGDLEIVFAQIAAALKDKLGEFNDMDAVSRAETLRGNRGQVLAAVSLMNSLGLEIDANNVNIRDKTEVYNTAKTGRDDATRRRDGLAGQKSQLEENISGARTSIRSSEEAIRSLDGQINTTTSTMRGLKLPDQQARYNELSNLLHGPTGLYAQRGNAEANIRNQNSNIDTWEGQIGQLNNQLGPLNEQIKNLNGVMDGADNSRKESAARIATLGPRMESFYADVASLLAGVNNATQGQVARDAAEVTPEGESFDLLLSNLARALVALGDVMSDNARLLDIVGTADGVGLTGTDSRPDRFGQLSSPVARAVAFAGMIGATMSALAEMLRGLAAGMGMQSAGELAAAGQSRVKVGL